MRKLATCTICEATCGIVLDVDGDTVTGVRGDPDDPLSRGYVCPKVVAMQDLHHDPDRLRQPLIRDPGRAEHRVGSWDEAFERASEGLRRVRRAHGRDSLAVYQGNPTAHNLGLLVVGQVAYRSLRTKNLYSASTADQIPHMRASHDMFGHVIFMPVPDIDRTDFWLVVGANPVVSNGSIMTAPDVRRRIKALHARGGKLVVVDPRRTETAELADQHLFLRPGSDALFFFALLHVVFGEGLAAPGRLAPMLAGMSELRALAERFSPERVSAVVGVAPEELRALARSFATARRAACYVRVGTCHQEHGTLASWLAYALAAVTGNLDREGGLMWTTPAFDILKIAETTGLGGHGRFKSRVRGLSETAGELPIATLADEIETEGTGRVRALLTSAGNPVLSAPNGRRLERALGSLEFMVSIDAFLNETTRHAHVILPPCSPLQRAHYDLALNAFAVENSAKWVDPPLPRAPDEKDDGEILRELVLRIHVGEKGRRLAVARAVARRLLDPERVIDLGLRAGPYGVGRGGLSVRSLRRSPHGVRLGPLEPRLPGLLRTKSRKLELAPPAFVAEVSALEATLDREVPPLVLVGRRQLRSNNSWLHNSERLVKGPARCTLLVHPDDARRRALTNGGRARVTTARGEVVATVCVSDEMMPGVVSLPHGWGHDRHGTRTRVATEHAGVSLNDLTDDVRIDRLTGNAAFSAVPVQISPEGPAVAQN
jgi:anaerobic selenocysteine-containing dehydrogenase